MTPTFKPFGYEYPEQAGIQLNSFDDQDGDQTRMDFTIRLPYLTEHTAVQYDSNGGTNLHVVMRGSWEASALLESMEDFCKQLRAAKVETPKIQERRRLRALILELQAEEFEAKYGKEAQ